MIPFATLPKGAPAGFAASVVLHAAVFALGGWALAKPAQYAVAAGGGGIEVHLVAAPAAAAPPGLEAPPAESALPPVSEPEDAPASEPAAETPPVQMPAPTPETSQPKILTSAASSHVGDGSSPVPGQDAATFHSAGGALTEAKPDYLRNPAPPYPWEAREKGWQGVVILAVDVDPSGRPTSVTVEKSSGHDSLDQSALKTVRKWRFRPARLGGLPVDSSVRVPVRFELEKSR